MTTLFLVSDIFGRTPALETIAQILSAAAPDIRIIDPYQGADHRFETEISAYDYFMGRVGLKKYQSILIGHAASFEPDTVLIGFSVGASAIWNIADQSHFRHIKKAFCFYGSQIRHDTDIQPLFDMEFIFPEQEPHFDVDELMCLLETKSHVACSKAKGLHGFMNELSPHFDPACYKKYIHYLKTYMLQEKNNDRTVRLKKGTP